MPPVTLQGFVLKTILPRRQGQSDESWARQKKKSEGAITQEAVILMFARSKGAKCLPRIEGLIDVDGSVAVVMEHAGTK